MKHLKKFEGFGVKESIKEILNKTGSNYKFADPGTPATQSGEPDLNEIVLKINEIIKEVNSIRSQVGPSTSF